MTGPDPTVPTESSFPPGADAPAAFPTDDNKRHAERLEETLFEVKRVIVGQDRMVERAMICLLARGHCLIEGVPGIAKTLTVSTLARAVGGTFTRLQFTPDLVPADIVGTRVWRPTREDFDIEWGPVFANLVLADEINRAPAKVQSALLEVMAERHVSIAGKTRSVPSPFLVLATQNPIESEGVYALPEAQRDRFLMQIVVNQPSYIEELEIARRMGVRPPEAQQMLTIEELVELQGAVDEIFVHHAVQDYAVRLVMATRDPVGWRVPQIAPHVGLGASPRATLGLLAAGRALALLRGRRFLVPQDIADVAPEVLRHRPILTYDALAEGVTTDDVINQVLTTMPMPQVTSRQEQDVQETA
jgi:MoxR-like ATPase